jgi:hypothetical protein
VMGLAAFLLKIFLLSYVGQRYQSSIYETPFPPPLDFPFLPTDSFGGRKA